MYRSAITVQCILLLATALAGQEWPQWRGAERDGTVTGVDLPAAWPERLTRKWKITVGVGHSSPVIADGKLYQFSRLNDRESIAAIDLASGKVLWRESYAAPYRMNSSARSHGMGPKSTPVVRDGKICTLGISGILSCFDAATGKRLWQKEFSQRFRDTSPLYGTAMSPIIHDGMLIAHVGGGSGGALTAFDPATGDEEWSWTGDGPGYASPIVVQIGGVEQLVTQTESKIAGFDPGSGELLWEIPFKTPWVQNVPTPAIHDGVLILSGLSNPTMALRVKNSGGGWTTEKLWESEESSMYMNSPVLSGGLAFGFTNRNKGQFFCLDASDGALRWKGEPRSGENAAIIRTGDTLFLLTDEAELTVARVNGERFEKLREYSVADTPAWAHPALTKNGILVKDLESLALWGW